MMAVLTGGISSDGGHHRGHKGWWRSPPGAQGVVAVTIKEHYGEFDY